MSQFRKHVFICTYGPYCGFDGDTEALLKRLKKRVGEAGLRDEVRINRSGCLNQCGHGPNVVVYPDDVWYCGVQADDADELFQEHLLNDRPVTRLLSPLPPGNNKDTSRYPAGVEEFKRLEKNLDRLREAERARIQARFELQDPPSDPE